MMNIYSVYIYWICISYYKRQHGICCVSNTQMIKALFFHFNFQTIFLPFSYSNINIVEHKQLQSTVSTQHKIVWYKLVRQRQILMDIGVIHCLSIILFGQCHLEMSNSILHQNSFCFIFFHLPKELVHLWRRMVEVDRHQ